MPEPFNYARAERERPVVLPEDCPEPFWHETHRYCPVCSWTEEHDQQNAGAAVPTGPARQVDGGSRGLPSTELAEAFIRGFQAGAERPEDAGDGDAMGQAFRDWHKQEVSAPSTDTLAEAPIIAVFSGVPLKIDQPHHGDRSTWINVTPTAIATTVLAALREAGWRLLPPAAAHREQVHIGGKPRP